MVLMWKESRVTKGKQLIQPGDHMTISHANIIVNCLRHVLYSRSKATFTMSMYTKSSFLEQIMRNSPESIHIEP